MKNSTCQIITILCLISSLQAMDTEMVDIEPSDKQCHNSLQEIAHAHFIKDLPAATTILRQTHDWGIAHEPEQLNKAYCNLLKHYRDKLTSNRHDEIIYDALCPVLDQYAEINHEGAIHYLNARIEQSVLSPFASHSSAKAYPFKLFLVLKKRDPAQFELIAQETLEKKFGLLFRSALAHPELIEALQDERLNLASLVQTALTNPNARDNLYDILHHENQQHITTFEQEIVKAVPIIFNENVIQTSTLQKLLQSPSSKIRTSTFSALLLSITNNEKNQWAHKEIINDIFDNEAIMPFQAEELYKQLFSSFQQANDYAKHYGTQRLIRRLAQPISPLLPRTVSQYFNLSDHEYQTPDVINEALSCALTQGTLPLDQLNSMLCAAQETNFESFIYPKIMQQLKTKVLLDEDAPTKVRVQLLDQLLITHRHAKQEHYPPLAQAIDKLPYSLFKRYAHTLLLALDHTLHQTAYFVARAELLALKKEHPDDFPAELEILKYYCKPLFYALREPTKLQKKSDQQPEPQYIHIEVKSNRNFEDVQFPKGLYCFGYVREHKDGNDIYQLHACNKKTGLPIWVNTIQDSKQHAYTSDEKHVYCATDDGNILQIDLATGDHLQKIGIPDYQLTPNKLHVCGPNMLCAVEDNHLVLFNITSGDFEIIPLPEQSDSISAISIGNRLIIPTIENLFILNNDGTYKQIPHHSNNEYFHIDSCTCASTHEFIIYQKTDNNEKQRLVCLETNDYNLLWEQPLNSKINQISISPSDNTIFILTNHSVLAFNPYADDDHRLLWKTELLYDYGPEVDSIYISQNGSTLYGIKKNYGKLYSFDIKTGQKKFLYEKKVGSHSVIVGDYDNKPYIQGINF